jgi:Na+/melibiose symporter-like transporter
MDIASILAKIVGIALLVWTLFSIYKHVKDRRIAMKENKEEEQSRAESLLNNALLYLWLAFMLAFSTGLVVNN